ncbi:hypothetical protein QW060_22480 [Myroides ceti]|uniref:Uncharacterized protein n=1 Tax=Paenimyroides ceti TaxID=395087 RepID=A0ABT8D1B0_9FLAO|nr:hypothetical protein [Paenimyroides ceti]MDN3709716.1 hypothetical protein [Paenimyroides ceti]
MRIDQLFQKRNFLNYELRHAYDYLIAYYKETGQPQKTAGSNRTSDCIKPPV